MIIILLAPFSVAAQFNPGARLSGLAENSVALSAPGNVFGNPSGIADIENVQLLGLYEHAFFTGIAAQQFGAIVPIARTNTGIALRRYGNELYQDLQARASIARRFGKLTLGTAFSLQNIRVTGFETLRSWEILSGFQYDFFPDWKVGSMLQWQISPRGSPGQSAPISLQAGISYKPGSTVLVTASVLQSRNEKSAAIGIEYVPFREIALRGGLRSDPFRQYAGFGWNLGHIELNSTFTNQPYLGYTAQFELLYAF